MLALNPNAMIPTAEDMPVAERGETFTLSDLGAALRKVTPTLLVVGIATGAAFAIGAGLINHFVFPPKRR